MTLEAKLRDIQKKLEEGDSIFRRSEASVSQGIVLPILRELNWDTDDIRFVRPERSAGKGKVDGRTDFTLCDDSGNPKVIIEVKKLGGVRGEGLVKLMQYAHSAHVPIVVLTDGGTWSFYLPGEGGLEYERKRVSKPLNISGHSSREPSEVLQRYLERSRVVSDEAHRTARVIFFLEKYRKDKPDMWREEVDDEIDKFVVPILSFLASRLVKKIESKSARDNIDHDIVDYFHSLLRERFSSLLTDTTAQPESEEQISTQSKPKDSRVKRPRVRIKELVILKQHYRGRNQSKAMALVFEKLQEEDPKFLQNFYEHSENQSEDGRRYLGRNQRELFGANEDERSHEQIGRDWIISTNYSWPGKKDIIQLAADVAGLKLKFEEDSSGKSASIIID